MECKSQEQRIIINHRLSLAEIDKSIREQYPELFKYKAAMMRAYKSADKSGNGFIEEPEFAMILYYLAYYKTLSDEFQKADKDQDKRLTKSEFIHYRRRLGSKESDEQLEREFDEIDTNDGGMILFDEFCEAMAKKSSNKIYGKKQVKSIEQQGKSKGPKEIPRQSGKILPLEMVSQWTPEQLQECFLRFDASNQNGM
jgi:Ca2+-binding EF-hand superfamily protein